MTYNCVFLITPKETKIWKTVHWFGFKRFHTENPKHYETTTRELIVSLKKRIRESENISLFHYVLMNVSVVPCLWRNQRSDIVEKCLNCKKQKNLPIVFVRGIISFYRYLLHATLFLSIVLAKIRMHSSRMRTVRCRGHLSYHAPLPPPRHARRPAMHAPHHRSCPHAHPPATHAPPEQNHRQV